MSLKFRKIPFSPPDMSEAEIAQVADTLRSGWITTGPKTKAFERQIAAYVGTAKAACLSSATATMEITLRLIGVGPDDEVIVPAYTYTASASVTQHVGCKLVLVDSQPDCVEMDYDKLADAITEKTKVIYPVDLGGIVCDFDRIFQIVEAKKALFRPSNEIQKRFGRIIVAADDAHAFGSQWHGKMAGSIADFSSFSFHAVKNLTTAEGGALVWNLPFADEPVSYDAWSTVPHIEGETWNEYLYRLSQLYSLHGQSKDALAKTQLGSWEYDVIGPWFKCNMTDITASIGLAQFQRYPAMLERRRQIIGMYDEALKDLPVAVLKHYGADFNSNGHLYLTRLLGCSDAQRREVITKMAERGIVCNVHYKPLPMMTAYKALGFDIKDFPNAYHLYENEVTLPLHTRLSDEDVAYVIENYVEVIKDICFSGGQSASRPHSSKSNVLFSNSIKPQSNPMERKRIYLCLAHMSEAGLEQKYIQEAFDTNWVVPLGPNVNGFEKDLEQFVNETKVVEPRPCHSQGGLCESEESMGGDGKHRSQAVAQPAAGMTCFPESILNKRVVALSAGTAAVHLSLIACGVQPGDEVIVQSFTFCASSHPITYLGAKPVFVDSEKDSWNMDVDLMEEAIKDRIAKTGKKPKAIIPVALYGMPYDIDRIMAVAEKYGIPVVEDAAEGFGSRWKGQVLGTFGKFGVLSFNGNKMITTSGGGALVCPDAAEWQRIMWLATQAREAYPYYQHEAIGYNYRMSNICAGIGRGQMTVVDDHIKHHKHVFELYKELLKDVQGIEVHGNPDERYDSNFWLNTITIDPSVRIKGQENAYKTVVQGAVGGAGGVVHAADSAHTDCEPNANVEALRVILDQAGIEARPLWKPMHKQPVYKDAVAYVCTRSNRGF